MVHVKKHLVQTIRSMRATKKAKHIYTQTHTHTHSLTNNTQSENTQRRTHTHLRERALCWLAGVPERRRKSLVIFATIIMTMMTVMLMLKACPRAWPVSISFSRQNLRVCVKPRHRPHERLRHAQVQKPLRRKDLIKKKTKNVV